MNVDAQSNLCTNQKHCGGDGVVRSCCKSLENTRFFLECCPIWAATGPMNPQNRQSVNLVIRQAFQTLRRAANLAACSDKHVAWSDPSVKMTLGPNHCANVFGKCCYLHFEKISTLCHNPHAESRACVIPVLRPVTLLVVEVHSSDPSQWCEVQGQWPS